MGVAQADAFIACWATKFRFNLLRPVTYIKRHIDPKWEPLLITPPFPEYPSGHSTQSGAASVVLTSIFGEDFAFDDATHVDDGLPVRSFPSFKAAAEEAALSRLYGGIHYRFGNEMGLEQGRCVGAFAAALRTEA
jgi:membrane-associated phospholipid phosphatase